MATSEPQQEFFDSEQNSECLLNIMKEAIDEAKASDTRISTRQTSKDGATADTNVFMSHDQFVKIMTKTVTEMVGIIKQVSEELNNDIKAVKKENVILRKEIVTARFELEKHQQYGNRDTVKILIKEPYLGPDEGKIPMKQW